MRVLVTGGSGFIGSALCLHLIEDGPDEILNIDSLTYAANPRSLVELKDEPRYRFLHADICDASKMRQAFADFGPQRVIHLAAESHVDRSITGSQRFIETNVNGTYVLLESARSYWSSLSGADRETFRFLHVSTDEVYGSLGSDDLFSETTAYDPASPYSASKAAADHLVLAWHRTYGLPTLISNCSNNYGPRQFPEKLIPLMILSALHGQPLPVYGDGCNVRDWLHVEDHVRALRIIAAHGQPGEKYNIGGRNERRNIDVVRSICGLLDRFHPSDESHERLIKFVEDRPGHDRRYAIDAGKLERELGWRAQHNFVSGIEQTVRWYLDNEGWWGPLREDIYDGQRLGLLTTEGGRAARFS